MTFPSCYSVLRLLIYRSLELARRRRFTTSFCLIRIKLISPGNSISASSDARGACDGRKCTCNVRYMNANEIGLHASAWLIMQSPYETTEARAHESVNKISRFVKVTLRVCLTHACHAFALPLCKVGVCTYTYAFELKCGYATHINIHTHTYI